MTVVVASLQMTQDNCPGLVPRARMFNSLMARGMEVECANTIELRENMLVGTWVCMVILRGQSAALRIACAKDENHRC